MNKGSDAANGMKLYELASFFVVLACTIHDVTFEDTCTISLGGKFIIAATIPWFLAAITSAYSYKCQTPEKEEEGVSAPQKEPLIHRSSAETDSADTFFTAGLPYL